MQRTARLLTVVSGVFLLLDGGLFLLASTYPGPFRGIIGLLYALAMLIVGIGYHVSFMIGLRRERAQLKADGLVHAESHFPPSLTLMVALLLLAIGFYVIASMVFGIGPFG